MSGISGDSSGGGERVPAVWGNVPQRNKNFTGRTYLLSELRERLGTKTTVVLPQAVYGLGGVGKTQLAMEYAYRFARDYEVVWWVSADQPGLVRAGLAALAPRLGLNVPLDRTEDAVAAVLDALRRGEPYTRWLLIFDNADQPEDLKGVQPQGTGHLLITSRNRRWQSVVETIEVDVFARTESLEFLQRRVPGIAPESADLLAEELGDLPLALEQAGALQAESGMTVDEYLALFAEKASQLLAENLPADYPQTVAAAWSVSKTAVAEHNPQALELLRRCAFFGPEPIRRDFFSNGRFALDEPMRGFLSDGLLLARATRELGRYALARIDNNENTLQVHRLVQRLVREELNAAEAEKIRHDVHLILAVADPGNPNDPKNWPSYAELSAHATSSHLVECQDPGSRDLFTNIVRYLYASGDNEVGFKEADHAITRWSEDSGPDDRHVLVMTGHKCNLLWASGEYQDAYELRRSTLERMRETLGPAHEETLALLSGHGADLRARGEFAGARVLDEESVELHQEVFADHLLTFYALNNLSVDLGLTSDYKGALELSERNYDDRRIFFGADDSIHVVRAQATLAMDQRQAGLYPEGRRTAERAYSLYRELIARGTLRELHADVLRAARILSVNRRKAGDFVEALALAEETYEKYTTSHPPDHPDRLYAGLNLGNALRAVNRTEESFNRINRTVSRFADALGPAHPYTYGSALNLALVRRQMGDLTEARSILDKSLAGLTDRLGQDHHYTLTCLANLATAISESGDAPAALQIGAETLPRFRELLGPNHPHTLVCATNYALDLRQVGRLDEADALAAETNERYHEVLFSGHPDVVAAVEGERLDFDFEPNPL
ncbi:FxSxx-COOH system tetratricopeptide repeat protein [Frankia sp. Cpl3]|nr:FxSxx-COOH system tetratricopeptide repeat protein [Frankia sp. Cpl3]